MLSKETIANAELDVSNIGAVANGEGGTITMRGGRVVSTISKVLADAAARLSVIRNGRDASELAVNRVFSAARGNLVAGQTSFNVGFDYRAATVVVTLNGSRLVLTDDYAAPGGRVITLRNGVSAGDVVQMDLFQIPASEGMSLVAASAAQPFLTRANDGVVLVQVTASNAYSNVGTGSMGAPRYFLGTLTPSGDDSALCVGRNVTGTSLFSHAFRDESVFRSNSDSAYTAYDARHKYITNSGAKYNHGFSFQASPEFAATNGVDLLSGHYSTARVTAGRVDRLHHFHADSMTKSGSGAVSNQRGFYCAELTGGDGTNWAFWAEKNPSFFGGDVFLDRGQIGGVGTLTVLDQVNTRSFNVTGTIVAFTAEGGLLLGGKYGGADYGGIQAYSNARGTPKGMVLQPSGGQVLVGRTGIPATGETLEVGGAIGSSESYRVAGTKVVGAQGAAVANATDAASTTARLNELLARLRAHGLIAS